MLAMLYLLLVFVFGDAICRRFFPYVSTPHRVATAFLAGLLLSTWITYAGAYLFGGSTFPMLAGNVIFAVIAIVGTFLLNRSTAPEPKTAIDGESTRFLRADWIIVGIFFVVAVVTAYSTFTMSDGTIRIAHHQSSDFGSTASIMQSFAIGHNFPTEYPHFTGDRIRYHFLFYFQAGNLEYLGFSPASANNTLSILTLLSLLVLVMTLGSVLFKSRLAGRIGAILFYFHGTLSFIPYYMKHGSISAVVEKAWVMDGFLPSGFPYRGEDWGVWSQVVYLNQRHLASSIGIFLLVLLFVTIRQRERYESDLAIADEKKKFIPEPTPAVEEDDSSKVEAVENESVGDGNKEPAEAAPDETVDLEDDEASVAEPVADSSALSVEPYEDEPVEETDDADDESANGSADAEGAPDEDGAVESSEPDRKHVDAETKLEENLIAWAKWLAPFAFCGLLLGLMPMWNGAVFAGAAGVLAVMFLLLPLRREMLAIAVVSGLVALPQVIFLKSGLAPAGYSTWYFGYTLSEPTVAKMLYYLAFTFGFKWVFIAIALIFGNRLQRIMIVSITALLVMATCFQFSEEVLANHKFFNVWVVLVNVPVGFGIVKLWNLLPSPGAAVARILTGIFIFMIVFSGILDLFPIKNSFWVDYRFQNDPLVEWVRNNTDPRSIFLSHRYVNHGILMAGRRLYYGHPYYAWGAGYPVGERDITYRKMLESKDINEVFALIKQNKIDYVAIDGTVRNGSDFIKANNENLFKAYFPVVWTDSENKYDQLTIYQVPAELGPPKDPTLLANTTATAAPKDTPAPITNMFTGGKGSGSGQFDWPRGISADREGNIYVADTNNRRIQKFNAKGEFLFSFGGMGGEPGKFNEPTGVAVDTKGDVYVADFLNRRVQKLKVDGTPLDKYATPETEFAPRDVAVGTDQSIYVADESKAQVVKFDKSGAIVAAFGSKGAGDGQFDQITSVTVDDKGDRVYAADPRQGRIVIFDRKGKFLGNLLIDEWRTVENGWYLHDLFFDPERKVLYASSTQTDEILAIEPSGNRQPSLKPNPPDRLEGAASIVVSKGRLFVVSTFAGKISAIDLAPAPAASSEAKPK